MKIPKMTRHATGQARVRINGRDYYLGTYGSPEAEEKYRQLIARLLSGQPTAPQGVAVTVREVLALFIEHKAKTLGSHTREPAQFRSAFKPLAEMFGSEPARDFSPKKLKLLQVAMVQKGWCRNVIDHRINRVRMAFKWAESEELVKPGTSATLRTVEPIPKTYPGVRLTPPIRPSSREDVAKVANELRKRSPRAAAMLELQWVTGMRSGEVRTIRGCDLDRAGDIWLYRPATAKTDHFEDHAPRVIALSVEAQKLLTPWLRADPNEYLFPSRRAPLYTDNGYALMVRHAGRRIGVSVRPQAGRHSFKQRVTRALGADAARAAMGHSSIEMTNRYANEQDVQAAIDVARKLA